MYTNIKNLPFNPETPGTNQYMTECGYSQQYPWKVIKKTAKTRTLAKVIVKRDPDWKPEIMPGGFAGHCTNQCDQTWLYDRVEGEITVTVRQNKKGQWVNKGTRFLEDRAVEFYDYNF